MEQQYTHWDKVVKKVTHFDLDFSDMSIQTNFNKLMNHEIPSMDQFITVCQMATRYLSEYQNVVDVDIQPHDKLVIVGDIHGCFESLIRMFFGTYKTESFGLEEYPYQPVGFPSKKTIDVRKYELCQVIRDQYISPQLEFPITVDQNIQTDNSPAKLEQFTQLGGGNRLISGEKDFRFKKQIVNQQLINLLETDILLSLEENSKQRTIFLFNGDMIDKGGSSYQVLFWLLYLCLCGREIYLNRGNHEQDDVSLQFINNSPIVYELKRKFPDCDLNYIKPILSDLFASLPIATKFQKILTAHAGTPDTREEYYLKDLLQENRFKQKNFFWDPTGRDTFWHSFVWNYKRNCYTALFMERNDLDVVVCGHSPDCTHNKRIFTKEAFESSDEDQDDWTPQYEQDGQIYDKNNKYFIEIFSSPTNNSEIFVGVLITDEHGVLPVDDNKWQYVKIGSRNEF
ncbi:Serine/threonine-protein_phosphatase [Hexamita inflata]|uniref:Serine/threonine-protein phosphatase n=1 Tax=Hexamita inflata TaxID=28002 RepID=A0AA86R631_9EUKA|nr:Serine/threonine-protein phosphatase [Hexamita inflata]CAI9966722.1 Serine/threonine-protein phosphatase [Hexamita inflata]